MFQKVLDHAFYLKKEGYRSSTISSRTKALRGLARKTNLLDSESVKEVIAGLDVTEGRKENLVTVYSLFCQQNNIRFNPPRYHRIEKLPFIPLESEIDQLIAGMGRKHSCYLQGLKELRCRAGELWNLEWSNIDLGKQSVTITPEKGSNPRQLRISSKLVAMLNSLPRNGDRVFGSGDLDDFARWFYVKRADLASKLQNPRLRRIGFKTFRHWGASTLYHSTRDILLVMRTLGHKDIRNTLVYTHLIDDKDDSFVCRTAKDLEEASSLIEAGFEYVTDLEGIKLFRKRK